MGVEGRVVVVTGAARGMGRGYVKGFLEHGAKVVGLDLTWAPTGISGDRDESFYHELAQRDDMLMVDCDITDAEQVSHAYEATMDKFGTVDCVIHNAMLMQRTLFPTVMRPTILDATTDKDYERSIGVGVLGSLKVTRAFIKPMIEKRRGSIIAASSRGGVVTKPEPDGISWSYLRPGSREQPYQAAKAALTNMMGYLADEVKQYNIAVNIIFPAGTRTTGYEERAELRASLGEPREDTHGVNRPEHVVPLALFLAEQDASTGITGKIIDAQGWNEQNGFGGPEAWRVED